MTRPVADEADEPGKVLGTGFGGIAAIGLELGVRPGFGQQQAAHPESEMMVL